MNSTLLVQELESLIGQDFSWRAEEGDVLEKCLGVFFHGLGLNWHGYRELGQVLGEDNEYSEACVCLG